MAALFNSVAEAFQQMGWKFRKISEHEVIEADFDAHHTRVHIHVQTFPQLNAISVVSQSQEAIPPSHKGRVCELLMRTNELLTMGNFEMRWDEGVVLFRSSQFFRDEKGDMKITASLVHAAVAEMDRMTPMLSILAKTPAESLNKVQLKELMEREDLIPPIGNDE